VRDEVWLVFLEHVWFSWLADMTYLVVTGDCLFDIECTAHDSIGEIGRVWFIDKRASRESGLVLPWYGCAFV
jgi:hypothetical protein